MGRLARWQDGIPYVSGATERDARYPSPDTNQRVYRIDTDEQERWNGTSWVPAGVGGVVRNVKRYGAKGDGSTDDTAAIIAAHDASSDGDSLFFPYGDYKTTGLAITKPLTIFGESNGEYHTSRPRISLSGNAEYLLKFDNLTDDLNTQKFGGLVQGLILHGGDFAVSDALVAAEGFSRTTFRNVGFHNCTGNAVRLRVFFEGLFDHCMWRNIDASAATGVVVLDDRYQSTADLNVNNINIRSCHFERNTGVYIHSHATGNVDIIRISQTKFEWGLSSVPTSGPFSLIKLGEAHRVRIAFNHFTNFKNANKYDVLFEIGHGTDTSASFTIRDNDFSGVDASTIALKAAGQARGEFKDNTVYSSNNVVPTASITSRQSVVFEPPRLRDTGVATFGADTLKANLPLAAKSSSAASRFISVHDLMVDAGGATATFVADANAINPTGTAATKATAGATIASIPIHLMKGWPGPVRVGVRTRSASGAGTIRFQVNTTTLAEQTAGSTYSTLFFDLTAAQLAVLGDNTSDRFRFSTGAANAENVYIDGIYLVPLAQSGVSSDRGDASVTLTASDFPTQRFATALTANRTVTLPAAGFNGRKFRIVRTGLGAFTLDVGGLKTIASGTAAFVDVEDNGTAYVLTGYGAL